MLENPEPAIKSILAKIEDARVSTQIDAQGNQYPRITMVKDHFRPGQGHETLDGNIVIENVVLRSSWIFALIDSGYEVNVSVYRRWVGHKTTTEPNETWFGISVCHPDWDGLMEEVATVDGEHNWAENLDDFFPGGDGGKDGFLHFLSKMKEIRQYL